MSDTRLKKDKNQHIQVFVRVRPINNTEKNGKSVTVVEVPSNKEVIIRERPQDKLSKKFMFDKVFGPSSKQIDVYNAVVNPLLEEVLAGYNCTVFAYGQTGTGKTFTMEGVSNDPTLHWQSDTSAGIIPRALSHLFDELRMLEAQEYTVRISFLELYNEELFDLLSPNDDASKIRLYEDASKKGAVIIHGLEEVTVHNKNEVYKILEKGSEKRQTAATLMNAHSSRSHTVFSITVHIKENTVEGEELLKTGKLNLVDLAGSENVGRSGAIDRRAREAGNINQSLLTLGRVITALVERAPHIPYRESKLTRLLQESLGGRTKTSIIATVSPASINLEETLSTLDYAYRAKNITNRPEINQKLSKKALLKEYTEEIERLRRDLLATRERNGVYLAQDNYNEMQELIECQGREIEEKINHIKALEETMQNKEKLFSEVSNELKNKLQNTTEILKTTKNNLKVTTRDRDEQKHLVEKHVSTEKTLFSQAQALLNVADTASTDTYKLHDKIIRKSKVEQENENLGQQFRNRIVQHFQNIENDLSVYTQELVEFCIAMKTQIDGHIVLQDQNVDIANNISRQLCNDELAASTTLSEDINDTYAEYHRHLENEVKNALNLTDDQCKILIDISSKLIPEKQDSMRKKISENLRSLNNQVSQKLKHLSTYFKNSLDTACEKLLMDRENLCQNVEDIRSNIQNFVQNHTETDEKRKKLFAKMFEDMWGHYNTLLKIEDDNSTVLNNTVNRVTNVCEQIVKYNSENCDTMIKEQNNTQEQIQGDIQTIEDNVQKNTMLANETLEEIDALLITLQTNMNNTNDVLIDYKNTVEHNAKQFYDKTGTDKQRFLKSVHEIHKVVSDASVNHMKFLEEQRTKKADTCSEMGNKFTNKSIESSDWKNKIVTKLHAVHHQIDKFLEEDLRRDVPTGSTPARKEFRYPRQLVTTSPHERIIQRFRETQKYVEENVEEDDDESTLLGQDTNSLILSSMSLESMDSTIVSPGQESTVIRNTSTPYVNSVNKQITSNNCSNYNLVKAASTSDLTRTSFQSLEYSIQSEPDMCGKNDNKENGVDDFIKPEKSTTKRLSKLKTMNRRILGTHN